MPPKNDDRARALMVRDLAALQEQLFEAWLDESVPDEWHGMDAELEGKKTEVELELDADLVGWFRRRFAEVGPVFNLILRTYWRAVVSGQVRTHWQPEVYAPSRERYISALVRRQVRRLSEAGFGADVLEGLEAAVAELEAAHRGHDPLLGMWEEWTPGAATPPGDAGEETARAAPKPEPGKPRRRKKPLRKNKEGS